ncbi:hypothetical protein CSIRO_3547 [Bradyrhizobiaceae bacterium SG-6C]|nr:hypothetical protein CSIRO_3547 [Bradyrhizobiaceae bacterium SG-6C]
MGSPIREGQKTGLKGGLRAADVHPGATATAKAAGVMAKGTAKAKAR